MVNRYLEAAPLQTFFGAQVCISGIQNLSWYKRGEQGQRRGRFLPKSRAGLAEIPAVPAGAAAPHSGLASREVSRYPEELPWCRGFCVPVSWYMVMNQLPRSTFTQQCSPAFESRREAWKRKYLILFISLSVPASQGGWKRKHPTEVSGKKIVFLILRGIVGLFLFLKGKEKKKKGRKVRRKWKIRGGNKMEKKKKEEKWGEKRGKGKG